MDDSPRAVWAGRFRAVAASAAAPRWARPNDPHAFADDRGHRRAVDAPFLAHRLRAAPGPTPAGVAGDVALWWAVHDHRLDPAAIIAGGTAGSGPLLGPGSRRTLEVGTESELGALHALWQLAKLRGQPQWAERCLAAAAWLVDNLEADNATAHPWAAHVFIELAIVRSVAEAELYAGSLLHACQAVNGRADAFSGFILADAAEELAPAAPTSA